MGFIRNPPLKINKPPLLLYFVLSDWNKKEIENAAFFSGDCGYFLLAILFSIRTYLGQKIPQ